MDGDGDFQPFDKLANEGLQGFPTKNNPGGDCYRVGGNSNVSKLFLDGGFKDSLISPLGRCSNLTNIFQMG